jgi:hypothetical protein
MRNLSLIFVKYSNVWTAMVSIKPTKCRFGTPKIEYCGRVISKDGLSMSEKKIASVINFHFLSLRGNLKALDSLTTFVTLYLTIVL